LEPDHSCLILVPSPHEGEEEVAETIGVLTQHGIVMSPSARSLERRLHKGTPEVVGMLGILPLVIHLGAMIGGLFSSGGSAAPIVIPLTQILGPPFFTLLGAWLTARYGRKIRVKIDGVEIVAGSIGELAALLQKVKEFQEKKTSGDEGRSS